MKTIFFVVCTIFFAAESFGQHDSILKKKIDSLYSVDQQVQTDMITAYQNNAGQKVFDNLNTIKEEAFKRHIPFLKEIIRQKGFPGYKQVGRGSSDKCMTMINHSFSDIAFQQKIAKLGKKQAKKKNISTPDLAMIIDKMKIKSGQKQIYGTQCDYTDKGEAIATNLYRPATVDRRRKEMGLSSLKNYLQIMTDLHRQMNERK
jgi:hypothetical protein